MLFSRFVLDDFAKGKDYEGGSTKASYSARQRAKNQFKNKKLVTNLLNVNMRLVYEDRYQQRAIHPLYFQQPEPQKII